MAEFDNFNFDTSSDEGEFEGFTPDDAIKSIEKGAQLREINVLGTFTKIYGQNLMDFIN